MSTSESEPAHIIAIFSPKPENVDEVRRLMIDQARAVHANEDYCLRFVVTEQWNASSSAAPDFVLFETYKSRDCVARHVAEPHFKQFAAGLGFGGQGPELLSKAPYAAYTSTIGGFETDMKLI